MKVSIPLAIVAWLFVCFIWAWLGTGPMFIIILLLAALISF